MSDATWWSKGVVASHAISKGDLKDLHGIDKGLDKVSTMIFAFYIYIGGDSGYSAINNAHLAVRSIKSDAHICKSQDYKMNVKAK